MTTTPEPAHEPGGPHVKTADLPIRLAVERRDRHGWLMVLAVLGLVVGAVMAVYGLPPVDLHGPLHYLGVMDPLCGGTRGVRLAMQGHFGLAWRYNPLAIPLVAGAAALLLRQMYGLVTGDWLNLYLVRRRPVIIIATVLTVALEINQQAHASLLHPAGERFSLAGPTLTMLLGTVSGLVLWVSMSRKQRQIQQLLSERRTADSEAPAGSAE